jgi:hypothetical protein
LLVARDGYLDEGNGNLHRDDSCGIYVSLQAANATMQRKETGEE